MAAQVPLSFKLASNDANATVFQPTSVKDVPGSKNANPIRIFNWESPPAIEGADVSAHQFSHYLDKVRVVVKLGLSSGIKPSRFVYKFTVPEVSATVPLPGSTPIFTVVGVATASLTLACEGTVSKATRTKLHYLVQQMVNGFAQTNFVEGTNVLT